MENKNTTSVVYGLYTPVYSTRTYRTYLGYFDKKYASILIMEELKNLAEKDKSLRALYLNFLEFMEDNGYLEEEGDD
jgi:hypothetical protein